MEIAIERTSLQKALSRIHGLGHKGENVPILGHAHISAASGCATLCTTDMEISTSETIPAVISKRGSCTVHVRALWDIVRNLKGDKPVTLRYTGGEHADIRVGKYSAQVASLSVDEFPQFVAAESRFHFSLDAPVLASMIDRTRFAISTDPTRYYLNGLHLHVGDADDGARLHAVATDGLRLSSTSVPLPDGASLMPGVIVPRRAVIEARKLLDGAEGAVGIELSDTHIAFTLNGGRLLSKLVDGTFPEYQRIVPTGYTRNARVNRGEFCNAVGRVSLVSGNSGQPVKLTLSRDSMLLSCRALDIGSAEERIPDGMVTYDGEPFEIGFQARFLTDAADQIAETIDMSFGTELSAAVMRDVGDAATFYLAMPTRI